VELQHLGTWFSGELGSVRFTVGFNDFKGLFQAELFYDSVFINEHLFALHLLPFLQW